MTVVTDSTEAWTLCLACARFAADLTDGRPVREHCARLTPHASLVHEAELQGLLAWLARALHHADAPAAWRALVDSAAVPAAALTLQQLARTLRVTTALAHDGVPALPYKGAVLSQQLYGDAAMRSSTDIDLVVPLDRYPVARARLQQLGYHSRAEMSERQEQSLFGWLGHAPFSADATLVELHWRFAPRHLPFRLDVQDAIGRGATLVIGNTAVPVMADDDLLAVLSMHGARHLYERLEWLAGVVRLAGRTSVSPAELLSRARELRGARMLLASLLIAEAVLNAPLGPEWSAAVHADAAVRPLALALANTMGPSEGADTRQPGHAALQLLYSRLLDSRRDRIRSMFHSALLPTEREWELVRLPDAMLSLYRLIRPLRLLGLYLSRTFSSRPSS